MKFLLFSLLIYLLSSCATDPKDSRSNKYLKEKNNKTLEEIIDDDINDSIDFYPIPSTAVNESSQAYDLPMPNQFFSAENKNEIRLHSLGEIRWIYVGLEPSKVWPILKEYLENDNFVELGAIDPNKGIMESKTFDHLGKLSKFEYKLERGLQRESSELFISHLVKEKDKVQEGDSLLILDAMKMENIIKSDFNGTISKISVKENQSVSADEMLISFD